MTDLLALIKDSVAYKIIKKDKENNTLSHAYLIISQDKLYIKEYLKIFAKLIICKEEEPCLKCRSCKLTDGEIHPDIKIYPKEDSIKTDDIADLIEESFVKPIEGDIKLFLLSNAEDMNLQSQNKLLKTLEEPPKNVCILIGATSEYPLLSTIKSRVKKTEISPFSNEKLFNALKNDYPDSERLKRAIIAGDGSVGRAEILYGDEKFSDITNFAVEVITKMKSSKEVLDYSVKYNLLKADFNEFLDVLEVYFRELMISLSGGEKLKSNIESLQTDGYTLGAVIYILERINEAREKKKYNTSDAMNIEWLLFAILEGKHKWQK